MKVLFDHPLPFLVAHGGVQNQIEQTKQGLETLGVQVEHLRWWDESQKGDLIHYFGTASVPYLRLAREKRIPVVMTSLFSETCNRSDARLRIQGLLVRAALRLPFGEGIKLQLSWRAFSLCAHNIVGLKVERRVLELVYGIPIERTSVVPLGTSDIFIDSGPGARSAEYLVCVGTITECKGSVPLAYLAKEANVPVLFVGKPYAQSDPYWLKFASLIDNQWVRYRPHIETTPEMVALLQTVRGAVIMSRYENWCLAAHEAAACGLPLLLPSKRWAKERFGSKAHYFTGSAKTDVAVLRQFYHSAPSLPPSRIQQYRWTEAAQILVSVYERVLHTSS